MKVISLWQPWASLVVMGAKKIEVRGWQTSYRGDLLIHASAKKISRRLSSFYESADYFKSHVPELDALPLGAIIGRVVLADIYTTNTLLLNPELFEGSQLQELALDDYGPNRYAWMLREPVKFKHVLPMKGALGLWDYNGVTETD